jgi:hypothetical protein
VKLESNLIKLAGGRISAPAKSVFNAYLDYVVTESPLVQCSIGLQVHPWRSVHGECNRKAIHGSCGAWTDPARGIRLVHPLRVVTLRVRFRRKCPPTNEPLFIGQDRSKACINVCFGSLSGCIYFLLPSRWRYERPALTTAPMTRQRQRFESLAIGMKLVASQSRRASIVRG